MKTLTVFVLLACVVFTLGQEDGKYRPTEATTTTQYLRTFPVTTTKLPVHNDPRYNWNSARQWPNDRYDPRQDAPAVDPRYDPRNNNPRYDPSINNPRYDPRVTITTAQPRYNPRHNIPTTQPGFDTRFNPVDYVPRTYHDYRTIRLDEKVNAKGYSYVYETVGGILAEEVGTFQKVGLKNEGLSVQGYVQITDAEGEKYRIDYQSDSKEAYIPRRVGEAPRMPPSLVKLLSLLDLHK